MFRAAVVKEPPTFADLSAVVHVDIGQNDLFAPSSPGQGLPEGIADEGPAKELRISFDADPVDGAHRCAIGDGVPPHDVLPGLLPIALGLFNSQYRADGRGIEYHLRPYESYGPGGLREPLIVTDEDRQTSDRGLEDLEPSISGIEVVLFVKILIMGDVGLTIFTQITAVLLENGGGIVQPLVRCLIDGTADDDRSVSWANLDSSSVTMPGMVFSTALLSALPSGSSSLGKYRVVNSSGRQTTCAPRSAASLDMLIALRKLASTSKDMAIWTSPTLRIRSMGIL